MPFDEEGRRAELAELAMWRDGPERLSVRLITGEAGQGKSRLGGPSSTRIRLLLLARQTGNWWHNLARSLSEQQVPVPAEHRALGALHPGSAEDAFAAAVAAFRPRLGDLPGLPTVDGTTVDAVPPDLSAETFDNALSVQTAALTALLDAGDPDGEAPVEAEPEADLYRHEMRHATRVAHRYGFDREGRLSGAADDRRAAADRARRTLLTALVLLSPRDEEGLRRCAGLVTDDDAAAKALIGAVWVAASTDTSDAVVAGLTVLAATLAENSHPPFWERLAALLVDYGIMYLQYGHDIEGDERLAEAHATEPAAAEVRWNELTGTPWPHDLPDWSSS